MKPVLIIGGHDYAPLVEELNISRNDLDAEGSGRDVQTGLMHRTRVATKLKADVKDVVKYGGAGVESTYDKYQKGHEFFPIYQNYLNDNANLVGNSANLNTDNAGYFAKKGWTVHPVVNL